MRFITKTNWIIILVVLAAGALAIGTASSVSSCCGNPDPEPVAIQPIVFAPPAPVVVARPMPVVVTQQVARPVSNCNVCSPPPAPVIVQRPAFRTVRETVMKEEEITTYETVWDVETRYRTRTVSKQVPETTVKQETVKVSKPVWETVEKETSYDVVRYVQETSEREEVKTVCKPVTEYQERQIVETVSKPVQETVMQQRTYQVNRPVTSCQTRVRDDGGYVTRYAPQSGKEYTRLTWQKGGDYYDPATGKTKYRMPGLYWTDLTGPTQYKAQQVYESKMVTETVPVTTLVPETVVENVPVTVNKVVQEQVVRTEQVPVTRMVQEQVVNKIPVTTYKPVTEKVVQKTPVKVCRIETVDEVREVPVTTYKTVTETIQEPYTVKVARQVPKVVKVQRPVTVCRQVPVDPCSPCGLPLPCAAAGSAVTAPTSTPSPIAAEPTPAPEAAPTGADAIPTFNEGEKGSAASEQTTPAAAPATTETTSKYPGPIKVSADEEVITTDEPQSTAPQSADMPAVALAEKVKKTENKAPVVTAPVKTAKVQSSVSAEGKTTDSPASTAAVPEADKVPLLKERDDSVDRSAKSAVPAMKTTEMKVYRPEQEPNLVPEERETPVAASSDNLPVVRTANTEGFFDFRRSTEDESAPRPEIPENSPTRLLKF